MACNCGKRKQNGNGAVPAAAPPKGTEKMLLLIGAGAAYGSVTGIRYPFAAGKQYVDERDAAGLVRDGYEYA